MTKDTSASTTLSQQRTEEPMDLPAAAITLLRGIEFLRAEIASTERIGTTELRALARISEGHTLTPKQLAAALGLTTGAVTSLTDRLVDSGLLLRAPHPTDRRSLTLQLTPAGDTVMQRINVNFRAAIMEAAEGATKAQIDEMAGLLQATATRMLESAQAER
ncbi:MAG TPA: MarR family transcriptional regulator [Galbitalea sp.]|nr:MarR family transcriptional regulator [Galbitalea sp.]